MRQDFRMIQTIRHLMLGNQYPTCGSRFQSSKQMVEEQGRRLALPPSPRPMERRVCSPGTEASHRNGVDMLGKLGTALMGGGTMEREVPLGLDGARQA